MRIEYGPPGERAIRRMQVTGATGGQIGGEALGTHARWESGARFAVTEESVTDIAAAPTGIRRDFVPRTRGCLQLSANDENGQESICARRECERRIFIPEAMTQYSHICNDPGQIPFPAF